jgi:acyl transferase domain-containing protein
MTRSQGNERATPDTGWPTDVAIVGMAGRFPGADSVSGLWQSLLDGQEAIRRLGIEELRAVGVCEKQLSDPAYIPYGAGLSSMEDFDAAFFRMTPAEAAVTDPQHRLFMECAWRAMEDGDIPPTDRIGVFASTGFVNYLVHHVLPAGDYIGRELPYAVRLGNQLDFLPSRLSYALNLKGPSCAVQTACSSALAGVDAACTALMMKRCDVAIVGAASVSLPQPAGYLYAEGGVLSRDGHCRPFDAAASIVTIYTLLSVESVSTTTVPTRSAIPLRAPRGRSLPSLKPSPAPASPRRRSATSKHLPPELRSVIPSKSTHW